jgi:hypothetical protein
MSEYPKMLFKDDGSHKIVASSEAEQGATKEGWGTQPSEIHHSRFSEHHTTRVPVNSPDQNQTRQQAPDEEALTARIMQKLADQGLLRRPPGRPPGSSSTSNGE